MKALQDRILKEGEVLPGGILKVGSFLNFQIDPVFTMEMGKEIARLFKNDRVTRVLTIETSGIPAALAAALCLDVPMAFAKKHKSDNVSGAVLSTRIHSYTHGNDYTAVVERQFIHPGDRVLLVDDFLANGEALQGLKRIAEQGGAQVVGAAVAIEKGFQPGGKRLRESGMRVESLAIIDSMQDGRILFREA